MIFEPLEAAYGLITAARNRLYDHSFLKSHGCAIPVMSVGNLTSGGSGKTPLCIYLAKELRKYSFRPVVLAKGYKGALSGPHPVTGADTVHDVGDEALLFARHAGCPVVVAHDKTKGARFIEDAGLGDIIVLDDGFQHRSLARDLDIVCVDVSSSRAVQEFRKGRLLPDGRFRESRDRGLRRADIMVLSHRHPSGDAVDVSPVRALIPSDIPVFESFYAPLPLQSIAVDRSLAPCPVVAVSGIANADGFTKSLLSLGFRIIASYPCPDHDRAFKKRLVDIRGKHPHLPIVCTEKDAVRLPRNFMESVYALPVGISIAGSPEAPLCTACLNVLQDSATSPPKNGLFVGTGKERPKLEDVVIDSDRLRLQPMSMQYVQDVFREFTDDITRYMVPRPSRDLSETEDFINVSRERLSAGSDLTMAIVLRESGEFLGCCGLHSRGDPMHPEIGIWIKKEAHGNRYGREAIAALVDWAGTRLQYEYCVYPVDKENVPSRRIPETLGGTIFKEEEHQTMRGPVLDCVIYKLPHPKQ